MQDDVPLADTLKRRLKRLRDGENEARRAVAAEALSVGRRREHMGYDWLYLFGGVCRFIFGRKAKLIIQLCSDVFAWNAK